MVLCTRCQMCNVWVSECLFVCDLLVFALVPRLVEHQRELCVSYEPWEKKFPSVACYNCRMEKQLGRVSVFVVCVCCCDVLVGKPDTKLAAFGSGASFSSGFRPVVVRLLLVVFQSFFGVPNHCSLHSSLSFPLDSGVDCAAQRHLSVRSRGIIE